VAVAEAEHKQVLRLVVVALEVDILELEEDNSLDLAFLFI